MSGRPAIRRPGLLVTGFGPFPGAPANPTEALIRSLAAMIPEDFGAGAFRAVVLPAEFRRGWTQLRALTARFGPDIVVHFGLSNRAEALQIERQAKKRVDPEKPDAAGCRVRSSYGRQPGPEVLPTTVDASTIVAALNQAGHAAELSDDAGDYVCNSVLYRSLRDARSGNRAVGFVHVPPEGRGEFTATRLCEAATIILRTAIVEWGRGAR